ncbi:MAG: hypothetical protein RL148_260 [Planctomycetota bacterium]
MQHPWLAAPLACALVGLLVAGRRRWPWLVPLDQPDAGRKDHAAAMPLAGAALAPFLLVAAPDACSAAAVALALGCGLLDDHGKQQGRGLGWRTKAACLAAASVLVALGTVAEPSARPVAFLLVFAFAFVVTNALNFLDCMDGVCLLLTAIALLGFHGTEPAAALAGWALVGALPWNWPRPRMFLGDAGALAAGTLLAAWSLQRTPLSAAVALPALVPLLDFAQVVVVRLAVGQPPWVGDHRHLPHRLRALGLPRALVPVVLALAAGTGLLLA